VAKTWPPLPNEITTTLATIVTTSNANQNTLSTKTHIQISPQNKKTQAP
jgi:hypothetical protein